MGTLRALWPAPLLGLLIFLGCGDDACPDGQTECGELCVSLQTDPSNCGSCGEACGPGEVCAMGACATECPPPLTDCGGSCFDLDRDESNCGACGTACSVGEACVSGTCTLQCPPGLTDCEGSCVRLDGDRDNCGACGTTCAPGEVCEAGSCALVCPPNLTDCDGTCRDTQVDLANCGACGTTCGTDELCVSGACTLTCQGGTPDACDGACTNLQIDPTNCGACGTACGPDEVCDAGLCAGRCGPGRIRCGQVCTSTSSDPLNCGACGAPCDEALGAIALCLDGTCGFTCAAGFDDCDDDLFSGTTNGCEVDLSADANNCGACGTVCDFANGAGACTGGACVLSACDTGFGDCNMVGADGCEVDLRADDNNCGACGTVCPAGELCSNGTCAPSGESCSTPITLTSGSSQYPYVATTQDHLFVTPSCVSVGSLDGPDVVFAYTATISGQVEISLAKPTSQRFVFVFSDSPCGVTADEDLCISEFSGTSMSGDLNVRVGRTYFGYLSDTTSGSQSLPNPADITVTTQLDCANVATASVTSLSPTASSTTPGRTPQIEVTFDRGVTTNTGTITVTGTQGTTRTYDLSTNPPEVSFNGDGSVLTITSTVPFPVDEVVTVQWSGIEDDLCGGPIPSPSPAWTFTIGRPPCTPGQGGMVGSSVSRLTTTISVTTEYYVAADASPTGYVYVGGTSQLERVPKGGGTVQDVEALAGLTTSNLGYEMLIDGNDIYTIESKTTGTSGHVFRISSDGGTTWNVVDAVNFPVVPGDDFRSAAVWGSRIYLMTHEGSSSSDTEVWSFTRGSTVAVSAQREVAFSGETSCSGLAVDDSFVYAACSGSERLVRVDRGTGAVTLVTTQFDMSSTNNSLYGVDQDNDGLIDILYLHTWYEEGYFVCEPDGNPFVGNHFDFGGSNSNYGMGFDRSGRLYCFDDDSDEVVIIQ